MRAELIVMWSETWREISRPLIDDEGVPEEIFREPYCTLDPALTHQSSIEARADIIDNPVQRREAFEQSSDDDLAGSHDFASVMESAHTVLNDLGGEASRMP